MTYAYYIRSRGTLLNRSSYVEETKRPYQAESDISATSAVTFMIQKRVIPMGNKTRDAVRGIPDSWSARYAAHPRICCESGRMKLSALKGGLPARCFHHMMPLPAVRRSRARSGEKTRFLRLCFIGRQLHKADSAERFQSLVMRGVLDRNSLSKTSPRVNSSKLKNMGIFRWKVRYKASQHLRRVRRRFCNVKVEQD